MLLQGRPAEGSLKLYYLCDNELNHTSHEEFYLTESTCSLEDKTRCNRDKEVTMLKVHPFPSQTRMTKTEAMTVNLSEVFNKLSYSRQVEENSGEINEKKIFHVRAPQHQSTG